MLLLAGAFFTSCTQTDSPPETNTKYTDTYADVSGLTDGQKYQFSVTSSNTNTAISGVSSYKSGTVRVFWTRAAGDSSKVTVSSSSPGSLTFIEWAPATSGGIFRLYETADLTAGHPSGLVLGPTPMVLSVGDANAATMIDAVLATDNTIATPFISLVAPNVAGSQVTGSNRSTRFSTTASAVNGGLAMQSLNADFASQVSATRNYFDITPTTHNGSSEIVYAKTIDNHYSRIEIIPQATSTFGGVSGNFLWGDGGTPSRRFIDVNVTYQPTAGLGN